MYDDICYESPFLKEVVVRIDYPSFLSGSEESIDKRIEEAIMANFPIREQQTLSTHQVSMSSDSLQASRTESKEWIFHGKERDKTLRIGKTYFSLSITKYKNFENLVSDIKNPLEEIYKIFPNLTSNRVGLRYVNAISIKNKSNPLKWDSYINKDMLSLLKIEFNKSLICRVFSIMEYNIDGLMLKAQFGIPNPDYPSSVKQKEFIIDIDAARF